MYIFEHVRTLSYITSRRFWDQPLAIFLSIGKITEIWCALISALTTECEHDLQLRLCTPVRSLSAHVLAAACVLVAETAARSAATVGCGRSNTVAIVTGVYTSQQRTCSWCNLRCCIGSIGWEIRFRMDDFNQSTVQVNWIFLHFAPCKGVKFCYERICMSVCL